MSDDRTATAKELLDGTGHDLSDLLLLDSPSSDEPPGTHLLVMDLTFDAYPKKALWEPEIQHDGETKAIGTALLSLVPLDEVPEDIPEELLTELEEGRGVHWLAYDFEKALRGNFDVDRDNTILYGELT